MSWTVDTRQHLSWVWLPALWKERGNAQLIARPLAARLGGGATYNPCVLYLAQVGFEHWLIDLLASFGSK